MKAIHLKRSRLIAIGVGLVATALILIVGFQFFSGGFTRATDVMPRDVVISDISSNSTKVSWTTGVDSQGVIEYGVSPTTLNAFSPEGAQTKQHAQTMTLLAPSTTYYFQIRIGDTKYDNGGVPWTFTTRPATDTTTSTDVPTPTPSQLLLPTPTTDPSNVAKPTPIQSLVIPADGSPATSSTPEVCDATDCDVIKSKLGKGCTTQDYFKCVYKLTPTP